MEDNYYEHEVRHYSMKRMLFVMNPYSGVRKGAKYLADKPADILTILENH